MLEPGIDFLPKSYTPGILARRVREMLDDGIASHCQAEKGVPDASPVATQ